jgi:(2R)-3-sulfolactate dehydrogenase (NADP+)
LCYSAPAPLRHLERIAVELLAALAMLVEVLAVALTGARFGFEASSFFDAEGPPPAVGQLLLVIDPGAFAGEEAFAERIGALAEMAGQEQGVRLPGARRLEMRAKAHRDGIKVDAKLLADVRALAG